MTTPAQAAQDLYDRLAPGANLARDVYITSRTPWDLQAAMAAILAANPNVTLGPTQAVVANGGAVNVKQWDNSTVPGVATVAGGAVTNVAPNVVATKAIIAHNGAVVVHSLADANLAGSPGTATVAAGVFTKANLTV